MLGSTLLDGLTTPLWRWNRRFQVKSTTTSSASSAIQFVDVGREAGLNAPSVWGDPNHKHYIIEAKGCGIAFFDYDQDGWLDIYLTNGTRLNETWPSGQAPTSHLYKNNRDGTFTDVTEKSGLARTGWQTGVCVGDYDNDGDIDIVTNNRGDFPSLLRNDGGNA
ncbi:MAG TPA: VCBS repeat-containing protein, partial [Candidatus Binatia bacterium]|nr:VCBS repeat-containing protein [Candidatus Binatia bacterium]